MKMTKLNGFTLIELLIALLIVAIIAIVSTITYTAYARKGRRIDAINSILAISLAEESYRAKNTQYGTLSQAYDGTSTSSEGYYNLSVSNVTASSYTITATAIGSQASDTEDNTSCATLTLDMSNGTVTKTPSVCWPN